MYLYLLNKQNIELSKAEILALSKNKEFDLIDNFLLIDELINFERLAYTKKVFKILFTSSNKTFLVDFKNYDFNINYKESFKLQLLNNKNFNLVELADIIWNKLKNPKTNLKNPKTIFEIIFSSKIFVCSLIWENKDKFEERRAHLRPYNHPTSLHPRLARCLVNLANSNEILDPFCGSGGLLIEAGLIGLNIIGFDLDKLMLKRTEENLKHYKIKNYDLKHINALLIKQKVQAVVTDLPYGKNSKAEELKSLFSNFLKTYFKHTKKMVVVFPDFIDSERIINQSKWVIEQSFSYYLHKSLSKKIFLLKNT